MKKQFLLVCLLAISFTSFGDNNSIRQLAKTTDDDPMLNNGFFLHLGIGFPRFTYGSASLDPGTQFGIEFGNQWYFTKMGNMGFGLKATWLQFGYNTRSSSLGSVKASIDIYEVRIPKIGPMFTYAISENKALDFSLDVSYPVLVQVVVPDKGDSKAYPYGGLSVSPCVRFRYNKFALGFDYSLGNQKYLGDDKNLTDDDAQGYYVARFFVGMKF